MIGVRYVNNSFIGFKIYINEAYCFIISYKYMTYLRDDICFCKEMFSSSSSA